MKVRLSQQTTLCRKQIDVCARGQSLKVARLDCWTANLLIYMKILCCQWNAVCCELEECLGLDQRNKLAILKHTRPDSFYVIIQVTGIFTKLFRKLLSTKHSAKATYRVRYRKPLLFVCWRFILWFFWHHSLPFFLCPCPTLCVLGVPDNHSVL